MRIDQQAEDHVRISNFMYQVEISPTCFVLTDPRTGHELLRTASPLLLAPVFHGRQQQWGEATVQVHPAASGAVRIEATAPSQGGEALRVSLKCWPEHIEIAAEADVIDDAVVASWDLFEPGMHLNFFHLHHFRNRHGHTATYETHNLYQGGKSPDQVASPAFPQEMRDQYTRVCDVNTYSGDWQFTPHPSFMLMQRDSIMLGLAARDLPHGFGLVLRAQARTLEHCRYDYGGEHGQVVSASTSGPTTLKAPRTYLWLDHHGSVWDSVDHYVTLLQEDEEVPRRSLRDVPHWWLQPAYCTWQDQGYLSRNTAFYSFPGDTFKGKDPVATFDSAMLDHLLDMLEREQLPFGTVILDDGWQQVRGDWTPHAERFPNLRGQIDRIHAMGMKVLLWMAPFDFHKESPVVEKPQWLCGHGVRGPHDMPMVDFSNPAVREGYLEPLAERLFSPSKGCLDADGLKLDFMADKIHPVFPVHDSDWRGEERFILGWQRMMYEQLRKWKSDGQMLGCAVHPHFIDCQDLIRTYDVPVSQSQHANRARMIRHFNPGNLVALDMTENKSLPDVEEHLDIAFRHNLLFECGRVAPDPKTDQSRLGPEYMMILKRKLAAWGKASR